MFKSIPELMRDFKKNEEEVLKKIDSDPALRYSEVDGLVVANASKSLFEPEEPHHLYAKGIVYKRDPYKLVSMPLVKMYNHGRKEMSDRVTEDLMIQPDCDIYFCEKLDGTMIQVFAYGGKVYLTTRSMIEGCDVESEFDFLGEARRILGEQYPDLLDPEFVEDRTFILELIHPDNRIVTEYDKEDMVVLSIYSDYHYWPTYKTLMFCVKHNLSYANHQKLRGNLADGIQGVKDRLSKTDNYPEGVVIYFERKKQVAHRVKVKMPDYLRLFQLKFNCTFRHTCNLCWANGIKSWGEFEEFLKAGDFAEEEFMDDYREYWDMYEGWYKSKILMIRLMAARMASNYDSPREIVDELGVDHPMFHYVITHKREGELSDTHLAKMNKAHKKFGYVLTEEGHDNYRS